MEQTRPDQFGVIRTLRSELLSGFQTMALIGDLLTPENVGFLIA